MGHPPDGTISETSTDFEHPSSAQAACLLTGALPAQPCLREPGTNNYFKLRDIFLIGGGPYVNVLSRSD